MPGQSRQREIADTIAGYRPRWMVYNDGGGDWRCMVLDERGSNGGDLSPGGTLLLIEADAGARFGVHNHFADGGAACTEVFVALEGCFEIADASGRVTRLAPGDPYRVPPGEDHEVHAVTACALWAASIPTARGYGHVPTDIDGAAAGVRGGDDPRDGGPAAGPDGCAGAGSGVPCCAA